MKRLLWLPTLALALALAACGGGGGSTIITPPPAGGFTLSSLKGNYAFSMSGMDPSSGAYFVRTGSFVADGAGNISSGLEDVADLGATSPFGEVTFSGKYTMLANGRGTIVLTDSSGDPPLDWTMDLQSSSQGLLVETDGTFASSGSFNLQNINDFTASNFNGNYVFDFSGITLTGANVTNISIIGNISANGSGLITAGVLDSNDGNNGPSGPLALTVQGTYQLDPSYGATFGRGIATFAGYSYAFYIVDNTRIKFIEEDTLGGSSGDAVLQSGAIPTTTAGFTGSFAYLVGGSSSSGVNADAAVARFTAGAGGIGAISYDENNAGTNNGDIHISQGSNITNATYTIDSAGTGRGTFTFTDSTGGTFSYVFYLVSPNSGVIQDVSSGIVADGTLLAQSGSPFTLAGMAGSYVHNWNGVNNKSLNEEDFIAQFTLASGSSNNITGVLDGTVIGNGGNGYPDIGTQGTLTIATDSTTNNTLTIVAGSPLSVTFNSVAYIVDANTVLVLDTDKSNVLAGIVSRQSQ